MRLRTFALACAALMLAAALAACTSTGAGVGMMETQSGQEESSVFSWTSKDGGQTGTMTAITPDGDQYSGNFYQINSMTQEEQLAPLWDGWTGGWYDWNYWGPVMQTDFIIRYSGKVVANLIDLNGKHMRCRFHLIKPADGMEGGGSGECQCNGNTITATFQPK
ncbi:MAG: hypothetical protein AB1921_15040 [Thermodesulfobacteriota bacterium]